MHGDLEGEIAQHIQLDRAAQQVGLDLWRHEYNTLRPHQALQDRSPADLYRRSERRYREAEPDYGPGFLVRKVSAVGTIRWRTTPVFISNAVAGHHLGLRRGLDNHYEVWLHHLLLGHFDLQTYAFRVAPSRDTERARLSA
jgi:hypothetical protein